MKKFIIFVLVATTILAFSILGCKQPTSSDGLNDITSTYESNFIYAMKSKMQQLDIIPENIILYNGYYTESSQHVASGNLSVSTTKGIAMLLTFTSKTTNKPMYYLKFNDNIYTGDLQTTETYAEATFSGKKYKLDYICLEKYINKLFLCYTDASDKRYSFTFAKNQRYIEKEGFFIKTNPDCIFDGAQIFKMDNGTIISCDKYLVFFTKNGKKYFTSLGNGEKATDNSFIESNFNLEYTNTQAGKLKAEWDINYKFDGNCLNFTDPWKPNNAINTTDEYTLIYGSSNLLKTN